MCLSGPTDSQSTTRKPEMRKTFLLIFLIMTLLPVSSFADVAAVAGRVILTYNFSENTAIQRCIGYGYMRYQCSEVPAACNICTPSDSRAQCNAKVSVASQKSLDANLPRVSRLVSGAQRGVCSDDGQETPEECELKIAAACGAVALSRNPPRCGVVDPANVTPVEWINCEDQAAAAGLCPARSVDEHDVNGVLAGDLPHFFGCLAFIHAKVKQPLEEARDDGRTKMSMDAKTPVDLSADDE